MQGIVLVTHPSGDKDVIARVLTQSNGKISIFAKRNRSNRRQSASLIETLDYGTFDLSERKGDLFYLRSYRPKSSFPGIRSSLSKLSIAYFLLEVCDTVLPEGTEDDDGLFALLSATLEKVSEATDEREALKECCHAASQFLYLTGFSEHSDHKTSLHTLRRLIKEVESLNDRELRSKRALEETLASFVKRTKAAA